ncbi:hypothetical protein Nwi_3104 [Nitrobacter winogradskyi Nb-255]|uniref:Uncharacterized protein n=1 Tax=Nitrobacter winogradskyi (strain ATCC 25391 / DSM 10237 / CIP 104748 / NCIMB 11846 / Nb-255) TaxID=323098 RepID=Q3SMZ0_NITWN|nr:hypothetical protein Nwi_3104 [Nitrobacter winogradskyi Nb-255]
MRTYTRRSGTDFHNVLTAKQPTRRTCRGLSDKQKADAVRAYGPHAIWKDVGQRLLDNTCPHRTGRHEVNGYWPGWERLLQRRP